MDIAELHASLKKVMATVEEMMAAPKIFHSMPVGIKIEAGTQQTGEQFLASLKAGGHITHGIESIEINEASQIVIKTMEIF